MRKINVNVNKDVVVRVAKDLVQAVAVSIVLNETMKVGKKVVEKIKAKKDAYESETLEDMLKQVGEQK